MCSSMRSARRPLHERNPQMGHHNGVRPAAMSDPWLEARVHGLARNMRTMFPGGHLQTILGGVIPTSYSPGLPRPSRMTVTVEPGVRLRIEVTQNQEDSPIVT